MTVFLVVAVVTGLGAWLTGRLVQRRRQREGLSKLDLFRRHYSDESEDPWR